MQISWNIGGLHFSQEQRVFSRIGPKNDFLNVSKKAMFYVVLLKFSIARRGITSIDILIFVPDMKGCERVLFSVKCMRFLPTDGRFSPVEV